ncbi:MAG: ABC transporter permease [Alphaproteobacteria bacterium]|nr:ABC transporter permease [Alphaproteobacteria bacterium]
MSGMSRAFADLPLALTYARRELRTGLKGFRIFLACLALGVAAIAGVGSVSTAMLDGIQSNARELLGGDIDIRKIYQPADPEQRAYLEREGARVSEIVSMRSMSRTVSGQESALVELKAVDRAYPLVGALTVEPAAPLQDLMAERNGVFGAIVEPALAARLDLAVGDRFKLGDAELELRAIVTDEPDRVINFASFGPRVLISTEALPATGLVQLGSLIRYHYRVLLPTGTDPGRWMDALSDAFPDAGWRVRGLDNATPGYERFTDRVTLFLTLVGLTALLVGGVGVVMAVKSYLDGKTETVATLKCLGASGGFVFKTYLAVVLVLGAVGVVLGLAVGALAPLAAAQFANAMLPFEIPTRIYPVPLALAALYGMMTALTFSLWPLGKALEIKAAQLFRSSIAPLGGRPRWRIVLATGISAALLAALAILGSRDAGFATAFVVGSLAAVALFLGASWLVMRLATLAGRPRDPELRMALANLHRPGAPTPGVVLALGLGLTVLVTVALIQANLNRQVNEQIPHNAPAFFFIDIQPHQIAEFREVVGAVEGVSDVRVTPMVRGRITEIKGVPVAEAQVDPEVAWALNGDRGVTYSAEKPETAELESGAWWPSDYSGPPLISLDSRLAEGFGVEIGDSITLNVLGRPITGEVANTRVIEWGSLRMNFTFVFAPGVIETAPHTLISTLRVADPSIEAAVQRAVSNALPNVTAIRVKEALNAANRILEAVAISVRATAAVTLIAGTLVLAGAVAAGHARRVRDAIILKVLGATRIRIVKTYLLEYGLLGLATALIASVLGSGIAFGVVTQVMRSDFVLSVTAVATTAAVATVITLSMGFIGTWRALGQRPAGLLRNE